jgi:hypothetical protein
MSIVVGSNELVVDDDSPQETPPLAGLGAEPRCAHSAPPPVASSGPGVLRPAPPHRRWPPSAPTSIAKTAVLRHSGSGVHLSRPLPSTPSAAAIVVDSLSPNSGGSKLNPNAESFSPVSSRTAVNGGGRWCFSGFEASSAGSPLQSPPPPGLGMVVLVRRHSRRHRRWRPRWAGPRTVAAADVAPAHRLRSVVVAHPARLSSEPDADGFREVHSRRRWRRRWRRWQPPRPRSSRPVPKDLVGLCFNCLRSSHIRADCGFPSRCRTCRTEGHRARHCPELLSVAGAKRGRSSARAATRARGAPRRRASPARSRGVSEDTVSGAFASTGRSPSMPRCCDPPMPQPPRVDPAPPPSPPPPLPPQKDPRPPPPPR